MCLVPTPWATPACWMEWGSLSCRGKHWWKNFGASAFTILYCQSAVLLPRQVVLAGCWPNGAGEALQAPPCFHHYVHPSWYGVSSPAFGVGAFGCPADPVALPLVCGLRRSEIVCAERCRQAHTHSLSAGRGGGCPGAMRLRITGFSLVVSGAMLCGSFGQHQGFAFIPQSHAHSGTATLPANASCSGRGQGPGMPGVNARHLAHIQAHSVSRGRTAARHTEQVGGEVTKPTVCHLESL